MSLISNLGKTISIIFDLIKANISHIKNKKARTQHLWVILKRTNRVKNKNIKINIHSLLVYTLYKKKGFIVAEMVDAGL